MNLSIWQLIFLDQLWIKVGFVCWSLVFLFVQISWIHVDSDLLRLDQTHCSYQIEDCFYVSLFLLSDWILLLCFTFSSSSFFSWSCWTDNSFVLINYRKKLVLCADLLFPTCAGFIDSCWLNTLFLSDCHQIGNSLRFLWHHLSWGLSPSCSDACPCCIEKLADEFLDNIDVSFVQHSYSLFSTSVPTFN